MPRTGIDTDAWKQAFIHEFFHVLQMRHNASVMFRPAGNGWTEWWFTEASATWAETYFGRPRSWLTHARRFVPFQATASRTPLNVSAPKLHMYHAYVWPLFMQQEKNAGVIRQAWNRLSGVGPGDFAEADEVLDSLVQFRSQFRDFAVRMLDKLLPGDPIAPRLQRVDPDTPLEFPPPIEDRSRLVPVKIKDLGHAIAERLPPLTATYVRLDPHRDTRQLTLDFRKLQPEDALDVDLLVKVKGQDWVRRRVDPGERVRYCFNREDQHVVEMYVILSNHELARGTTIAGTFRVRPVAEPCGFYRFNGTWQVRSGTGGVMTDTDFSGTWNFSWDPGYDQGEPGTGTYRSSIATGIPLPCNPGQFDEYSGRLVPAASALGDRVTFIFHPVRPQGAPFADVFGTLFLAPYFGSRWVEVDIAGGSRRFRDGQIPIDVRCQGRSPTGRGSATIVRERDT
jgi:hypothetical protein